MRFELEIFPCRRVAFICGRAYDDMMGANSCRVGVRLWWLFACLTVAIP